MEAGLPRAKSRPPAAVSVSIALAQIDRHSLGRCVSHHADLGLRLPLVELAAALTPGYMLSPLRGWRIPSYVDSQHQNLGINPFGPLPGKAGMQQVGQTRGQRPTANQHEKAVYATTCFGEPP
jgi:hypothetical protein